MQGTTEARHLSVSINRDVAEVYGFLSAPENFPRWASGLGKLAWSGAEWVAQTSQGTARVRFSAPNVFGVLDHWIYPAPDAAIYIPMRLIKNGAGCELIFTLFRLPGMSDEQFSADTEWVLRDLQSAKTLLEAGKDEQAMAVEPATPGNILRKPRVGLALGSGSARGWAHVGVIRALEDAGIQPDLVCGTSIGALVGAAYAAGELDAFERWLRRLGLRDVLSFLDVGLSGGMIKGERLMEFFRTNFADRPVEDLPKPFGAVATALGTGTEVWLRKGSTVDAVRASIALPALFSPVLHEGHLLVDGGLTNPVPVSLARAMGADIVIAVDLSSGILGRHFRTSPKPEAGIAHVGDWRQIVLEKLGLFSLRPSAVPRLPSMIDVVTSSIDIMQVRISRARLARDPPDVVVAPHLAHLSLLDFHRAEGAIEEGKRAVKAALPGINALFAQIR